ncbi:hypothetical protein [Hyphococcus sp.]|jgi:hypothetical protein|uniref:hypothetical protein n=1 Tax=Hyphococcus sp. TaxID=2038636 RepID=UPI003D120AC8
MAHRIKTGLIIASLFFAMAACSGGNDGEEAAYGEGEEYWERAAEVDAMVAAEIEHVERMESLSAPDAPRFQQQGGAQVYNVASTGAQAGAPQRAMVKTTAQPLPDGAYRVKRVEIVDRTGFEKPLTAYTMMIPVDWQGQGEIVWGQNMGCGSSGYNTNFSASSPDGRSGVQIIPSFTWVWNNFSGPQQAGGCPFVQIGGVQQYLQYLVSQTRPGAQIIDFRPRPDLSKPYEPLNSTMPMGGGSEMRTWVEAGEVLISGNVNGAEIRETIAAVVYMNYSLMRDGTGMGPDMQILSGSAMPAYAMRAPNGQLDFTFAEMVRKTLRIAPEWGQRIARHNAKISATNIKGARDRSNIIAKTGSEILDMQMETWRNSNDSSDRMQRESSEAIRGVETYNDPYYGGTVELDHTYDNAWQLNDGSYVLTNDAMFEPYRDLGIDGQKLEVTQ